MGRDGVFSDYDIFLKVADALNFPLKVDDALVKLLSQTKVPFNRPDKVEGGASAAPADLSLFFSPKLFDDGVRMRESPHVHELAKEPKARLNSNEAKKRGIQEGQRVKISSNSHTIEAPVTIDNTVADKVLVLPLGFTDLPVNELGANLLNGIKGEIHV